MLMNPKKSVLLVIDVQAKLAPFIHDNAAVVEACGIEVVLNEIRQQPFHPDAFVGAGVDPWSKRVVVVKSSFHFNAGFAERAAAVLYCDAPGTLGGDARLRPYRHITRPIWPLDEVKM